MPLTHTFRQLPLSTLPGPHDTLLFLSSTAPPITISSSNLPGPYFARLLAPTAQFRTRRRKGLANDKRHKYILDLTPPTEGEEAVEVVEALWCPEEVVNWRAELEVGVRLYKEPDDGEEGDRVWVPEELQSYWRRAEQAAVRVPVEMNWERNEEGEVGKEEGKGDLGRGEDSWTMEAKAKRISQSADDTEAGDVMARGSAKKAVKFDLSEGLQEQMSTAIESVKAETEARADAIEHQTARNPSPVETTLSTAKSEQKKTTITTNGSVVPQAIAGPSKAAPTVGISPAEAKATIHPSRPLVDTSAYPSSIDAFDCAPTWCPPPSQSESANEPNSPLYDPTSPAASTDALLPIKAEADDIPGSVSPSSSNTEAPATSDVDVFDLITRVSGYRPDDNFVARAFCDAADPPPQITRTGIPSSSSSSSSSSVDTTAISVTPASAAGTSTATASPPFVSQSPNPTPIIPQCPPSPLPPIKYVSPPSYSHPRHTAALARLVCIFHNTEPHVYSATMWYTLHRLSLLLSCVDAVKDYTLRWLFTGSNVLFLDLHTPLCLTIATEIRSPLLYEAAFSRMVGRCVLYLTSPPSDNIAQAACAMAARLEHAWETLDDAVDVLDGVDGETEALKGDLRCIIRAQARNSRHPPAAPPRPHPSVDEFTWNLYRAGIAEKQRQWASRYSWLQVRDMEKVWRWGSVWSTERGYRMARRVWDDVKRRAEDILGDEDVAGDFQILVKMAEEERQEMPEWVWGGREMEVLGDGELGEKTAELKEIEEEREDTSGVRMSMLEVRDGKGVQQQQQVDEERDDKEQDDKEQESWEITSDAGSDFTLISNAESQFSEVSEAPTVVSLPDEEDGDMSEYDAGEEEEEDLCGYDSEEEMEFELDPFYGL